MKRLVLIGLAVLFVHLSYPSTHSVQAGTITAEETSSGSTDKRDLGGPRIGLSGDGDGGDADGLSGIRGGTAKVRPFAESSSTVSLERFQVMMHSWWNFMVFVR